jgi:phosphatidylethanolamine-binding protein
LNRPNISLSSGSFSQTGKAVLILIDPDVPRSGTRIPDLYWLAPDITGSVDGTNTTQLTLADPNVANGVPYLQPSPSAGDYAHRYVFLLFDQPRAFSIPASLGNLSANRLGFNLTAFIAQAGLTAPFAANYILVANNSGPATTSYPPASYSISTTASVVSSTGSATTARTGSSSTGSSSASRTSSGAGATSTSSSAATLERGSGFGLLMAAIWLLL